METVTVKTKVWTIFLRYQVQEKVTEVEHIVASVNAEE